MELGNLAGHLLVFMMVSSCFGSSIQQISSSRMELGNLAGHLLVFMMVSLTDCGNLAHMHPNTRRDHQRCYDTGIRALLLNTSTDTTHVLS